MVMPSESWHLKASFTQDMESAPSQTFWNTQCTLHSPARTEHLEIAPG